MTTYYLRICGDRRPTDGARCLMALGHEVGHRYSTDADHIEEQCETCERGRSKHVATNHPFAWTGRLTALANPCRQCEHPDEKGLHVCERGQRAIYDVMDQPMTEADRQQWWLAAHAPHPASRPVVATYDARTDPVPEIHSPNADAFQAALRARGKETAVLREGTEPTGTWDTVSDVREGLATSMSPATMPIRTSIIDHPSPNHSPRRPGVSVDTVLLHHTATNSEREAIDWLCRPGSGVSAHYVVSTGGIVYRLVPEGLKAWHAGLGRLPWETCPEYDFNHRSIGIEIVNPGDGKTPFTEAQYRALVWLVPDIVRRYMIRHEPPAVHKTCSGMSYILGHRDVAPGRKTDPADNFDWSRIREALASPPGVG